MDRTGNDFDITVSMPTENISIERKANSSLSLLDVSNVARSTLKDTTELNDFRCPFCKFYTSDRNDFKRHLQANTGQNLTHCKNISEIKSYNYVNTDIFNTSSKEYARTHNDEKSYQCTYCYKFFSQKGDLYSHLNIHSHGKPYQCTHCDKTFTNKSNLDVHLKRNTGEKPYQCNYCNKAYFFKWELDRHLKIHSKVKPYQCSHCDKTFSLKCNLDSHQKRHTGEKLYQCYHCTKAFLMKWELDRHLIIHAGEKPHKCSLCDKAFSWKTSLDNHMTKHTGEKPYQCNYCIKAFSMKCILVAHMNRHTGGKPYACSFCDKTFSVKSNLTRHRKIHTEDKPYQPRNDFQCPLCKYSTTDSNSFKNHLQANIGLSEDQCMIAKSQEQDLGAELLSPISSIKQEFDDVEINEVDIVITTNSVKQEL